MSGERAEDHINGCVEERWRSDDQITLDHMPWMVLQYLNNR